MEEEFDQMFRWNATIHEYHADFWTQNNRFGKKKRLDISPFIYMYYENQKFQFGY